jgi:membrane protein implicated in regulation of membrane protease activity
MYGVAWIIVAAVLVGLGVLLVAGIAIAAPLFALLVLLAVGAGALLFFAGRRQQIGTERERQARGQTGDGAPAAGEGSRPSTSEDYEPAL